MKIRKLLALTVVLAMIVTVTPAFGLTASAAIESGQGIVTSSNEPYAAVTDDLIADGSFETAAWEDALTTGAYVDASGGAPGLQAAIKMNSDETMAAKGATAFVRVEGRTGQAISPAMDDFTPNAAIHRYTNDANGPTSIKHYIRNEATKKKTYYISFWAKALKEGASIRYYIGENDGKSDPASSQSVNLKTDEWTQIDGVATVMPEGYMMVNVYNMGANAVALDDFEACEVTQSADSKAFADAISKWPTTFAHSNNDVLIEDIELPDKVGNATVSWESSDPQLLDPATGKIALVEENSPVVLTATITYRSMSKDMVYNFVVGGFKDRIKAIVSSGSFVPKYTDSRAENLNLPKTVPGFDGSVVTWTSSNEDVIENDGTYHAPDVVSKMTLTAHVVFNGVTIEQDVEVYVGAPIKYSVIPNGSFEVVEGSNIVDWTNGAMEPMTTANFDYMTEADGNHYILSKTHEGAEGAGSIKTFVNLEPGKFYNFSFKLWYNGEARCQECYTAALLVADTNAAINDDGSGDFASPSTYGGFALPRDSYNGKFSKNDGWQTINVGLLKPDETYHTLCITSRWLNKTDGGLSDGRWAFDDFILEEVESDHQENVTINFLDEEGNTLQKSATVKSWVNIEYYADSEYKADIVKGSGSRKTTYRYMPGLSTDHVMVTDNVKENVINLVFKQMVKSNVTVKFLDKDTGKSLKRDETDKDNGFIGFSYTAPNSYKAAIKVKDVVYTYDPTASQDTIVVTGDKDKDVVTLYFTVSNNLIKNGDFSDGYNGWETRTGQVLSGGSIGIDAELGTNALTIDTGGRTDPTAIGTIWPVETGKKYHLSFWVGGNKPDSTNYGYNRLSNNYKESGGVRENDGTDLIKFGETMENGKWNHFELDFEAATDVLYFQSSWTKGIKFANFELTEIDSSKMGGVKVNFVDETGATIKDSITTDELIADSTYTLPAEYKNDIEQGGYIYRFKSATAESVKVVEGQTVEITLTFEKLSAAEVTVSFKNRADGSTLKADEKTTGEVGKTFEIPSEMTASINSDGKMYVYDGCDPANLTVSSNSADNKITLYFVETSNLIPNGDFSNGLTGWTNRLASGDLTIAGPADHPEYVSVGMDDDLGKNALTITAQGRGASNAIGTVWNVTKGKTYKLSFWVGGGKPLASNYEYNRVTDARKHFEDKEENPYDCDGNTIIAYGENMAGGKWELMEAVFEAQTDMLYFECGWTEGAMKFADFQLIEVDTSKTGSVKIKFVDGEGNELKAPETIDDLTADSTYTVADSYKADITKGSVVYTLNAGKSTLSAKVVQNSTAEITLVFEPAPSTVTVTENKATVTANAALTGMAVVAQYDKDGRFLEAKTTKVDLAAGASGDIAIDFAENAVDVKVFVLSSMSEIAPMTNVAAVKAPGAPMVSSQGQNADSFHSIDSQTGKVRYTFELLDNGCTDAGIMLGNDSQLNTSSSNYFASGSIVLLFGNSTLHTRDSANKTQVATYTQGEKVTISVEADIAAGTYTLFVNGAEVATNVGFRVSVTDINILALAENGSGPAFEVYDFKVEAID